jgi:hypothetical protein
MDRKLTHVNPFLIGGTCNHEVFVCRMISWFLLEFKEFNEMFFSILKEDSFRNVKFEKGIEKGRIDLFSEDDGRNIAIEAKFEADIEKAQIEKYVDHLIKSEVKNKKFVLLVPTYRMKVLDVQEKWRSVKDYCLKNGIKTEKNMLAWDQIYEIFNKFDSVDLGANRIAKWVAEYIDHMCWIEMDKDQLKNDFEMLKKGKNKQFTDTVFWQNEKWGRSIENKVLWHAKNILEGNRIAGDKKENTFYGFSFGKNGSSNSWFGMIHPERMDRKPDTFFFICFINPPNPLKGREYFENKETFPSYKCYPIKLDLFESRDKLETYFLSLQL